MGFVGLGIFMALLFTAWWNASAILSQTQDRPELKWAHDLAQTLQYCLIPYFVSGAALNMAYFDLAYVIFALLAALRTQVGAPGHERLALPTVAISTR
jgi:hypothetical protein